MNVAAAVFVKFALHQGEQDQVEIKRERAMSFFRDADLSGDGMLAWDEFRKHLSHPIIKSFNRGQAMTELQARELFDQLDEDGSGECSIDEVVDGFCWQSTGDNT